MDVLLESGIAWIVALQGLEWLYSPMQFFTFLGSEEFFLLILPALYWCIDSRLGMRVGMILLFSGGINDALKLALHGPRPYWVSSAVKALTAETSFGVPSGHAQHAVGVWGILAAGVRRPWAWAAAVFIMLMIGLSRPLLGVHFLHDVLLGWLLGALVLWAFLRYWDRVAAWLQGLGLGRQVLFALGVSLLLVAASSLSYLSLQNRALDLAGWQAMAAQAGAHELPAPVTLNGTMTSAGALFGLAAGLAWLTARGGFDVSGPLWKRLLRYLIGLVGVLVLWFGLGQLFPRGDELVPYALRYLRYALVGAWISAGAPYLFLGLKLTNPGSK
jgi:membrane-associated phospholipid phosphatase